MRDPKERLRDILEAVERIERYAAKGLEGKQPKVVLENLVAA